MIRFVDLRKSNEDYGYCDGRFAWYNTVTSKFDAHNGIMTWGTFKEFENYYAGSDIERYRKLAPDWCFIEEKIMAKFDIAPDLKFWKLDNNDNPHSIILTSKNSTQDEYLRVYLPTCNRCFHFEWYDNGERDAYVMICNLNEFINSLLELREICKKKYGSKWIE